MPDPSKRCSFEFDSAAWEREHDGTCFVDTDEDILTENAEGDPVWRCPHEALDDEDACPFHLPRISDAKPDAQTVTDAFLEIANGEREMLDGDGLRPARFIGAEFQMLDLDADQVGNGRPIDLRHAEVGSSEWEVGTVESESLDLRGINIRSRWECNNVTFEGDVQFEQAEFSGDVWFPGAEFSGSAWFKQATFVGDTWFFGAEFNEYAWFEQTEFCREARFGKTEFSGTAHFEQAEFSEDAVFKGAEFDRNACFEQAEFSKNALFEGVRFNKIAGFEQSGFSRDAKFNGAEFGSGTRFKQAEFSGNTNFEQAKFGGDAGFPRAEFSKDARFNEAEFNGYAGFEKTEFSEDGQFVETKFSDDARFKEARINGTARFEKAHFGGTAWFKQIEFNGTAWFEHVTFAGDAGFSGAEFSETAWFEQVKFGGKAMFPGAKFGGTAQFKRAEFGQHAWFKQAEFEEGATFAIGGWYPVSQFQADADFSDVTAGDPLRFVDTYESPRGQPYTFLGETDFEGAAIPGVEFLGVSFRLTPTFADAEMRQADLSDCAFKGATFEGTNLLQADLSESDLSGAVFNDALLSQASLYGTDLTNSQLYGVRMDGAHISDHTDLGVRDRIGDWGQDEKKRSSVIPFFGPWPDIRYDDRNPEYDRFADGQASEDAEGDENISNYTRAATVYAEIERVAEANANSQLVSRCYLWRKDMQRKRYWSDEGRGNSRERVRWVRSLLAHFFVRYGESPWRVTGIAGLIILGCAVLYHLFGLIEYSTSPSQSALISEIGSTASSPAITFLDSLYFSTLTFSTLGMGTFQPSGPLGRAVVIFETLSGVVLLALLVFVFGRRATR